MIGFYWLHWTKRIDREGNFCETVALADERKEVDEQRLRQWWLLTTIAFGEWLKICKHQKLRFRSGFSLLRVVKCLLMPRSGEPSPVPKMNTHPLIFLSQCGETTTHLTTEPKTLSTVPNLTSPFWLQRTDLIMRTSNERLWNHLFLL